MEKCPPRGSVGNVTGFPLSSFSKNPAPLKVAAPYPSPDSASSSPIQLAKSRPNKQLVTPPLTPEDSNDLPSPARRSSFLMQLFPETASTVAQYATPFQINIGSIWDGFILTLPNGTKSLYVDGKAAAQADLRQRYVHCVSPCTIFLYNFCSVVSLLDLADEQLGCSSVVIALPKTASGLDGIIHALMYVGGQIVTRPPFKTNPSIVLVGLEI